MKYDYITKKLFWTTGRFGKLYAMDIDTESQHITMVAQGDWINALALHPCRGKIFWSDSGFKSRGGPYEPRIEMAGMSGNRRNVIIDKDISLVIALAVDNQNDMLYWADANKMRIERSNLDGNNREVLVEEYRSSRGLDIYGDYLYSVDINVGSLVRIDRFTGQSREVIASGLKSPLAVRIASNSKKFVEQQCPNFTNPCASQNGGCDQLCFVASTTLGIQSECSCNTSYKVSGQKSCVPSSEFCQAVDDFRCQSGDCVPITSTCDGTQQCLDGSDENPLYCITRRCPRLYYTCANRRCIDINKQCDGNNDCGDSSDELRCETTRLASFSSSNSECPSNMFKCSTNTCLNRTKVCDGRNDCRDAAVSDENNSTCPGLPIVCRGVKRRCPNTNICISPADLCDNYDDCGDGADEDKTYCAKAPCGSLHVRCPSGRCIPETWQCDGDNDCGDNWDERNCSSGNRTCV
uniref:Uncharacterized protein n=1 Tax=Romanomermis culicivorax TaxID=13658 RepID=A0A915LAE5_ROMCU